MALATMSLRVDEDTKKQVEAFCSDVGMNPSTSRLGEIPFTPPPTWLTCAAALHRPTPENSRPMN